MDRNNGIFVGVVSSLKDDEGLGRIRVTIPHLDDQQSYLASCVAPGNGKNRGFQAIPEVGDQVLVVSELGDPRRLYILGGIWSKKSRKPADDGKPEDNNWRQFQSRSGHVLRFDDTSGKEHVTVISKSGEQEIVIDASKKKIRIVCKQGDVEIVAREAVKVEAKTVEVKASQSATIDGGQTLTLKAGTVNIN